MGNPPEDTIMEERVEIMISPSGSDPFLRKAHFLKPTFSSTTPLSSPPPKTLTFDVRQTSLKVLFMGWRNPNEGWKEWVHLLLPKYQHIWKAVGVCDSILVSTFEISRDNDLVLALSQRWCVETNTFIFPWGESTITLEDMIVLGGYSVTGDSVLSSLSTDESRKIEEGLSRVWSDMYRRHYVGHNEWMSHFMNRGTDEFEHEAFLALWLSSYVFPPLHPGVGKYVLRIATHLSRGTRLALAPAVLASIYKDLSFLKKSIVSVSENEGARISLSAPLQFVQIWAWERFPTLRPTPNLIKIGEPRSSRWHNLKKPNVKDLRKALDLAGDDFQWRPYCPVLKNWKFKDFNKEIEAFSLCMRPCELVDLWGCVEQYLPHRVAMQFGMDQDIPDFVPRFNGIEDSAWCYYKRPIVDKNLYVPPRLFESDVTGRYSIWWDQKMLKHTISLNNMTERSDEGDFLPTKSKISSNDKEKVSFDSSNDDNVPRGILFECGRSYSRARKSSTFNIANEEGKKRKLESASQGALEEEVKKKALDSVGEEVGYKVDDCSTVTAVKVGIANKTRIG